MALSTFVIEETTLRIGRNTDGSEALMTVRGLSLNNLTALIHVAKDDVMGAVARLKETAGGDNVAESDLSAVAIELIQKWPELVARAIAHAAGEPECWRKVLSLPAPIQIDAVMAIGALTFTEEGSVKKFIEHLTVLVRQMTSNLSSNPGAIR